MKRLLPRLAIRLTVLSVAIAAAVAPVPGGALQLWVRVMHPDIGALPGFAAPYQLRNPVTQLCLQDYGDGAQVVLTTCSARRRRPAASRLWS
jgi:hypothetical protein